MFKLISKFLLQKLLGFDRYLFVFSIFTISRFRLFKYDQEFYHFLKMIPEEGNIMDIGSNIGITAVPMARRVSAGKLFCFEPIPQHIKTLKKITKRYQLSNITIFETALGETNGELTMVMPVVRQVKYQGYSQVVEKESDRIKGDLYTVPVIRLDELHVLHEFPKINAIKIDVENFEYRVLKGAENLLMRDKPIIFCELWDNEKRFLTINYLVKNLGYQVRVFEKNKLVEYKGQQTFHFYFI